MSVYVVSWGIVNQGRNMETDSIVHRTLDEAREEFDLIDLATAVKGPLAKMAVEHGCPSYCRIEEVEMLDEKEHPTNKLADWVYDASKTLIDEKVSQ